ncbi:MAG: 50S ribosomal protein L18 [Candidatus Omnitrophota bacterium]|nr:50S ribosomal protein L18 [Candidatus Omnitrophota bacterium]
MKNKRILSRVKRHNRIKMRMRGTVERPRLVIRRSLKNLFVEAIDDTRNKILFGASTLDLDFKKQFGCAGNVKAAAAFGVFYAAKAKAAGIKRIVFDRAGYLYHGRVKSFAEALRKGGLEF